MATQEFKFQLELGLCALGPWQGSEVTLVRQAGRRRAALGAQPPTICPSANPFVFLLLNHFRPISVTREMLAGEMSPGNEERAAASISGCSFWVGKCTEFSTADYFLCSWSLSAVSASLATPGGPQCTGWIALSVCVCV